MFQETTSFPAKDKKQKAKNNPINVKKSTRLGAEGVLHLTGYYQNATVSSIWSTVLSRGKKRMHQSTGKLGFTVGCFLSF